MKKTSTVLASLLFSVSALAAPDRYDTKFNVTANVPDSAVITHPDGTPATSLDVEMVPHNSGKMEARTEFLKLRNNDVAKLDVALTLDDGNSATGEAFKLMSTGGNVLNNMTYLIRAITTQGSQDFTYSGDTHDFTLLPNGSYGELPMQFQFISDKNHDELGQGHYSGTVYANVIAKP